MLLQGTPLAGAWEDARALATLARVSAPARPLPRPPLLLATAVRLDVGGLPALDGLELETRGERAVVVGGPRVLFEAAAGMRVAAHGELRTVGMAPPLAVRSRVTAGAPFEPPLPPRWTAQEYVVWSARLAGCDRKAARDQAREAIEAMELGALARARLGGLTPAAKRGVVLAAAIATGAEVLLVDDPLAGLADDAAAAFGSVVAKVLGRRRCVVFAARLPLELPLAAVADEVVLLDGPAVVAQGAPAALAAEQTVLALKVAGTAEEVAAYVRAIESSGGRAAVTAQVLGLTHLEVQRGPLGAKDLFRLAIESRANLLELRPFSLSLS